MKTYRNGKFRSVCRKTAFEIKFIPKKLNEENVESFYPCTMYPCA